MKIVRVEDAVGSVLCHDITQIVPSVYKGARFKKGHIIKEEDIPVLLSIGKKHIYVWENKEGFLHENDAAKRLLSLCLSNNMRASDEISEGKVELFSLVDGLFIVNSSLLKKINSISEIIIASRNGGRVVKSGDIIAGMRVVPLVIDERKIIKAEKIASGKELFTIKKWKLKKAAIIVTGSEVYNKLIKDKFTPVLRKKLKAYGIDLIFRRVCDDNKKNIISAIKNAKEEGSEVIFCTGGMSVDADDNTPSAIKEASGKKIVYGAPVLPGAMFMLSYFDDNTPVIGLPGCAMYAKTTILDIVMPYIAAGEILNKDFFTSLGEGGLCLRCKECHYPVCGFGVHHA